MGLVSILGFTTPIPYPFGAERTGYLVTDVNAATEVARSNGADVVVAPFSDPIGRDVIIEWPGGVHMQLYSHRAQRYAPLVARTGESCVRLTRQSRRIYSGFRDVCPWKCRVGRLQCTRHRRWHPNETYRRVRIESVFGRMTVLITDGHLPYPYGRETTGYEVADLRITLKKAVASGAAIIVAPYSAPGREAAIVQFPGGYVAEIHASTKQRSLCDRFGRCGDLNKVGDDARIQHVDSIAAGNLAPRCAGPART